KHFVLVGVEITSGLVQADAFKRATGENTVKALQEWFGIFPKPQEIQSDNGSHFTARVVQDWAKAHYMSVLGRYPSRRSPSLATVVLHDSKAYSPGEWEWDRDEWIKTLNGTIGEQIKVGCRKVEGSLYEKASTISIKNVGDFLCENEPNDCWHNFTLTKSAYVTCNWQNDTADKSSLKGLTYRFKINAVAEPTLSITITHRGTDTLLVLGKNNVFPSFIVTQGDSVAIRCNLIAESFVKPVTSYSIEHRGNVLFCEIKNQDCWLIITAVQFSHKVMCGENDTKYWGKLKLDVAMPTTQPLVMLSPEIFEIGPYIIKRIGQQQILLNPSWSLKQVNLLMQNNVSEVQTACSPSLETSFEGWTTWLRKRNSFNKRTQRDITGVVGTGLGILNNIDSEVLMNRLAATTRDLRKLQQPLQSSLSALGTHQWLLSNILPDWEKVNTKDHKLIVDALSATQNNTSLALSCIQAQLWMQSVAASIIREGKEGTFPTEIWKIIWDHATEFEKEYQSWWNLVNFTYNPITNVATAFMLTIRNASVYSVFPIIAFGLNHGKTVLYPFEHKQWAHQIDKKWQTVNLEACIVREQQGSICESNTLEAQDICLDTEQNIYHFEIHPKENPKTVLICIGDGCVCIRTACDKIIIESLVVDTKNNSNFCVCNFTKIKGCDFSYSAPVISYHLLQSNYSLRHQITPTPIGMNLTLVKQLLLHQDLIKILEKIKKTGQKTLITVHHNVKEIHHVLERVRKDEREDKRIKYTKNLKKRKILFLKPLGFFFPPPRP
uniref:Integrase catalytic domain-containing protein n=1 Tax=Malurus cyaneus samueli TaxID=2593467 RepID=A0A8C5TKU6_9PASS